MGGKEDGGGDKGRGCGDDYKGVKSKEEDNGIGEGNSGATKEKSGFGSGV